LLKKPIVYAFYMVFFLIAYTIFSFKQELNGLTYVEMEEKSRWW